MVTCRRLLHGGDAVPPTCRLQRYEKYLVFDFVEPMRVPLLRLRPLVFPSSAGLLWLLLLLHLPIVYAAVLAREVHTYFI